MHKVVWQEGMLLRPQHFQQNDRYYDYQLKTRTQKLDSYAWGFFELEIDRQFLNMGKLVVSKASGSRSAPISNRVPSGRMPLALLTTNLPILRNWRSISSSKKPQA
jgi:type VI secretion system protein ImpJ